MGVGAGIMGIKGSWSRPCSTTREEKQLREDFMYGKIKISEFNKRYEKLKEKGLIRRNGRTVT